MPAWLQFLLLVFAGWVNRRQLEAIDYLKAENRILREQLGGRRIRFTDARRRRLARAAKRAGRKGLFDLGPIVTPDTLQRWSQGLVARKYDSTDKRQPGRTPTPAEIAELVVRMALENPGWGYTRCVPQSTAARSAFRPCASASRGRSLSSVRSHRREAAAK